MSDLVRVVPGTLSIERATAMLAECRTTDDARGIRDKAEAVRLYLRATRASLEAQNTAAEIMLRAERRMGELLAHTVFSKGGRPGAKGKKTGTAKEPVITLTLGDLGLDKKESSYAQRLARMKVAEFEARIRLLKEAQDSLTRSKVLTLKVTAGSTPGVDFDGDEYGTPKRFIELERLVMGGIDFDPMSNARSQRVVRAKRWHDKKYDALRPEVEWRGRTHLNPPYSKGLIEQAIARVIDSPLPKAIVLVNTSTETGWFQRLVATGWPFCLVDGRIAFLDGDNEPCDQNRYAQAFFFRGCERNRIKKYFGDVGQLVKVY